MYLNARNNILFAFFVTFLSLLYNYSLFFFKLPTIFLNVFASLPSISFNQEFVDMNIFIIVLFWFVLFLICQTCSRKSINVKILNFKCSVLNVQVYASPPKRPLLSPCLVGYLDTSHWRLGTDPCAALRGSEPVTHVTELPELVWLFVFNAQ